MHKRYLLHNMKILGISGSLRAASINSAVLRAAHRLAPPEIEFALFHGTGELPLFNPELETALPPQVVAFHNAIAASDAILIASPEYAHAVSGVIKNALDWLVSFGPFAGKYVGVLNASARAHHADAALRETPSTMAVHLVEDASVRISLVGKCFTDTELAQDPQASSAIRQSLVALCIAYEHGFAGKAEGPAAIPRNC